MATKTLSSAEEVESQFREAQGRYDHLNRELAQLEARPSAQKTTPSWRTAKVDIEAELDELAPKLGALREQHQEALERELAEARQARTEFVAESGPVHTEAVARFRDGLAQAREALQVMNRIDAEDKASYSEVKELANALGVPPGPGSATKDYQKVYTSIALEALNPGLVHLERNLSRKSAESVKKAIYDGSRWDAWPKHMSSLEDTE